MIPYSRQQITDEDIAVVVEVLRSDFLTTGPAVPRFEEKLCGITGAAHAVACSNGTAALHLACAALDVGAGDTGLTSPLTFLASANCIEYCGGRADFIDIDPADLCLSAALLEEYCRVNAPPRVVVAVSFAGVTADLPAIRALSARYGFSVIEDAAHSLGSSYASGDAVFQSGSCAHTDLATLSFHPVKTITTGEGGAVLTNDPSLAARLRLLRSHGMSREDAGNGRPPWFYAMERPGFNYRLTDFQCALGIAQLARLGEFKRRRQELAGAYNALLKGAAGISLPPWPAGASPCFHLYPVRFTGGDPVRTRAYEALRRDGIQSQVHYYPVHLQPYYRRKYGYAEGKCPAAETFYAGCLSLPLYPGLGRGDQERIAAIVRGAAG